MAQKATRQNGGFNSTIGTLSLGRNHIWWINMGIHSNPTIKHRSSTSENWDSTLSTDMGKPWPLLWTPPQKGGAGFVCCALRALSGEIVAEIYVRKGQPWLHEVPFGRLCHQWGISNFQLLDGHGIVFPRPRLAALVPSDNSCNSVTLQVLIVNEPPSNLW